LLATPALLLLAALAYVAYPLHVLPGGHENKATGTYSWLGFQTHDRSFVPDWVRWNYSGYQSPLKPRHDEYFALMATMGDVGRQNGCGRAMWEYEEELDGMGTPMAPMLLPYWTHGCIGSMEGLFFEASATTPYHFLNQSELSMRPSRAQRDLPYVNLNVPAGVSHLQLLGVKYYMALTPEAQGAADTDPRLHLVATSGPWKVHYSTGDRDRTWKVYEVAGTDEVAPLDFQPVVMKGVAKGGKQWLAAAVSWYQDPQRWSVPLAVSGPASWSRVDGAVLDPPRTPITDPPKVTGIRTGDDRITFDVDTIGKPVLVKASYFPNWRVSGAKGPYRVTPNEMVVIPTAPHVSLHYANTPVDGLGYLASFLGLVALVLFARKGRIRYTKRPLPPAQPAPPAAEPWLYYADLERQLAGVTANGGSTVDAASYFDEPVGLSRGDPPN
jgi:hypothetical protein